jgi:hypothetical protein
MRKSPMTVHLPRWLLVLVLVQGCGEPKLSVNRIDPQQSGGNSLKLEGISKEAAIAIANEDALKDYKSLAAFKIVACEQSIFWRVIYDGGGPEYVIDKTSGTIIKKQIVPQGSIVTQSTNGADSRARTISQDEAIAAARRDVQETYDDKIDLDQLVVITCELSNVWRVIFDYRLKPGEKLQDLPHESFPKYVIDKKTGKILNRQMN